jgi:hypothetical protein
LQEQKRTQLIQDISQVRKEYSNENVKYGSVRDFLNKLDEE